MAEGARATDLGRLPGTFACLQDVLLEPYGGETWVGGWSNHVANRGMGIWRIGGLAYAARRLKAGLSAYRLMSIAFCWATCFPAVIVSAPWINHALFRRGVLIGLGSGLFAVSTLIAAMLLGENENTSPAGVGGMGASQATSAGLAIALAEPLGIGSTRSQCVAI